MFLSCFKYLTASNILLTLQGHSREHWDSMAGESAHGTAALEDSTALSARVEDACPLVWGLRTKGQSGTGVLGGTPATTLSGTHPGNSRCVQPRGKEWTCRGAAGAQHSARELRGDTAAGESQRCKEQKGKRQAELQRSPRKATARAGVTSQGPGPQPPQGRLALFSPLACAGHQTPSCSSLLGCVVTLWALCTSRLQHKKTRPHPASPASPPQAAWRVGPGLCARHKTQRGCLSPGHAFLNWGPGQSPEVAPWPVDAFSQGAQMGAAGSSWCSSLLPQLLPGASIRLALGRGSSVRRVLTPWTLGVGGGKTSLTGEGGVREVTGDSHRGREATPCPHWPAPGRSVSPRAWRA